MMVCPNNYIKRRYEIKLICLRKVFQRFRDETSSSIVLKMLGYLIKLLSTCIRTLKGYWSSQDTKWWMLCMLVIQRIVPCTNQIMVEHMMVLVIVFNHLYRLFEIILVLVLIQSYLYSSSTINTSILKNKVRRKLIVSFF